MKSEILVEAWVRSGIRDFCLYVELDDRWGSYNAFFLHQGLEKLCKAYLLGIRATEYERFKNEQRAREEVQKIAKKLGHDLQSMFKKLGDHGVISSDELSTMQVERKTYREIIEAMQQGYEECRYPLSPNPVYKKYPIKGYRKVYEDLLGSTVLRDVAYFIARQILAKICEHLSVGLSNDKSTYNAKISQSHWNLVLKVFPSRSG